MGLKRIGELSSAAHPGFNSWRGSVQYVRVQLRRSFIASFYGQEICGGGSEVGTWGDAIFRYSRRSLYTDINVKRTSLQVTVTSCLLEEHWIWQGKRALWEKQLRTVGRCAMQWSQLSRKPVCHCGLLNFVASMCNQDMPFSVLLRNRAILCKQIWEGHWNQRG